MWQDPLIHDRISNDVSLLTRQLALIASDGINAGLQLFFYASKCVASPDPLSACVGLLCSAAWAVWCVPVLVLTPSGDS